MRVSAHILYLISAVMAYTLPVEAASKSEGRSPAPLPAFTSDGSPIIDLREEPPAALAKREWCDSWGGTPGCITFYSQAITTNCGDQGYSGLRSSYRADCSGACYQYDSFKQLQFRAGEWLGVHCYLYNDIGCSSLSVDTGDLAGISQCYKTFFAWKSMRCYYGC